MRRNGASPRTPLRYVKQHDKQKEASASRQLIRALFWGNRVGKTEWGAQEVVKVALGEHEWIPPGEIWSFCPSFDEEKDTTQLKLLRYLPEAKILDRTWLRKGILKELVIDGGGRRSNITFKSYEQGREKAQGAGKVLIWFDEEPPKDIFDECSGSFKIGHQPWTLKAGVSTDVSTGNFYLSERDVSSVTTVLIEISP